MSERRGISFKSDNKLSLNREAGNFLRAALPNTESSVAVTAGNFDNDPLGQGDFIVADSSGQATLYINGSGAPPSPSNWNNPTYVLPPAFGAANTFSVSTGLGAHVVLAAGDFNGDGNTDFVRGVSSNTGTALEFSLFSNTNPATLTFSQTNALHSDSALTDLGRAMWSGTNAVVTDYNNDRKLDLLIGSNDNGGTVRIFLNTCSLATPIASTPASEPLRCSNTPTFRYTGILVQDMGFGVLGDGATPAFAYADFDDDGHADLVAGAPDCCAGTDQRLRIWRGLPEGGVDWSTMSLDAPGAVVSILVTDFSNDGRPDIVVSTDGEHYNSGTNIGGQTLYYANNTTKTPFSDGYISVADYNDPFRDIDGATIIDYDGDPDTLPDILLVDDSGSNGHLLFSNRVTNEYVLCGDTVSEVVNLGGLATTDLNITAARIDPNVSIGGGSINAYAANNDARQWVQFYQCPDNASELCVAFPKASGTRLRVKIEICRNPSFAFFTPTVTNFNLTYDYVQAKQHTRSGVVISDGVAYVGTFSQPGDRGHFFAIDTGLSTTFWDFGSKLDAMSDGDRVIYTSAPEDTSLFEFEWAGSPANQDGLQAALRTAGASQTQDVVNWARSARFGVGLPSVTPTRLGSIHTSTPAVLNKPGLPIWYARAGTDDRAAVDTFISDNSDRVPLVLVGSKSGMVHAIRNDPTNISNSRNGNEVWAYVPTEVAQGMLEDYTRSLTSGDVSVTRYPDGSPTLADVIIGDQLHTVAVLSGGYGGSSNTVLDVTRTVNPTTGAAIAPSILGEASPGGSFAGLGVAKPIVARMLVDEQVHFVILSGTGRHHDDLSSPYTKGRIVTAYSLTSGAALWNFQTNCPLTSNITVFETDDEADTEIDGFMDRAVFADSCGYVYKLDPGQNFSGGWNTTGTVLFSTISELGEERPIAGTIGARADSSSRVVLFFGTGGLEDFDPSKTNRFYAVYADTGLVRSATPPTPCPGNYCEKFYGGVVVTSEQVLITRTVDSEIGQAACDPGSTQLQALQLNPDGANDFVIDFTQPITSAGTSSSLYGDAGAIYLTTQGGDVIQVGTPRVTTAGQDTVNGDIGGTGTGEGSETGSTSALSLLGWRQVF